MRRFVVLAGSALVLSGCGPVSPTHPTSEDLIEIQRGDFMVGKVLWRRCPFFVAHELFPPESPRFLADMFFEDQDANRPLHDDALARLREAGAEVIHPFGLNGARVSVTRETFGRIVGRRGLNSVRAVPRSERMDLWVTVGVDDLGRLDTVRAQIEALGAEVTGDSRDSTTVVAPISMPAVHWGPRPWVAVLIADESLDELRTLAHVVGVRGEAGGTLCTV